MFIPWLKHRFTKSYFLNNVTTNQLIRPWRNRSASDDWLATFPRKEVSALSLCSLVAQQKDYTIVHTIHCSITDTGHELIEQAGALQRRAVTQILIQWKQMMLHSHRYSLLLWEHQVNRADAFPLTWYSPDIEHNCIIKPTEVKITS